MSTSRNVNVNQLCVILKNGTVYYYKTSDIEKVNFNDDNSQVELVVKNSDGTTETETLQNVARVRGLKKMDSSEGSGTYVNASGKVEIIDARGWRESAYITWKPFDGATSYRVQVKGENITAYTTIDQQLVRNYGTYGRADVVGLKAGTYSLRVIPVKDGTEVTDAANEATSLTVKAYPRQDFAHFKWANGVGAYNNDGTLKTGARVLYVTKDNAKTVTCDVVYDKKGKNRHSRASRIFFMPIRKAWTRQPLPCASSA